MPSLLTSARVTRLQLVKGIGQAKVWIALLFVPLVLWPALSPVKRMALDVGERVSIMGVVFIFSDIYNSALCTLFSVGAVLLFSDAPFFDQQQQQCLMRVGRRVWISSELLYILCISILYMLYWIIWTVIILAPGISFSLEWGTVWKTLAYTDAANQYGVELDCPVALIRSYEGPRSLALSLLLKAAISMMYGNLCFAVSLWTKSNAGVYVCLALIMQDYMSMNGLGLNYIKFAPQSMSRLIMLDAIGTGSKPTPLFALTVLLSVSAICALLSYLARRKTFPEERV